jgi:catechol 2,3-dioxygenase-like lactoylglutathione lyase family enzyme
MDGKLSFLYAPTNNMKSALNFYRDKLGLEEAWREGDGTVAFKIPGSEIELMVDLLEEGVHDTAGPMFVLSSVDAFYEEEKDQLNFVRKPSDIPPGRWAALRDPDGNMFYVLDMSKTQQ